MRIGDFELHLLLAGGWRPDGGATFAAVPKALWEQEVHADERNLIPAACVAAVVRTGGKTIVCETGIGQKLSEKRARQVGQWEPNGLLTGLQGIGVRPNEVDVVLTTHLHWDHAGGFTRRGTNGSIDLTFPRAKHFVQRAEWDFALHPDRRSANGYVPEDFVPVADAGRLETVDGDAEIVPGVVLRLTGGHTPGSQVVIFRHGDFACAMLGDMVGMRPHLKLSWINAADLDPLTTLREKAKLLDEAAVHRWLLILGHDLQHPAGYFSSGEHWIPDQELEREMESVGGSGHGSTVV